MKLSTLYFLSLPVVPLLCWLGGYEFNKRELFLSVIVVVSLAFAGAVVAFYNIHKHLNEP